MSGWRLMIKANYIIPTGKEIMTSKRTFRFRETEDNCYEAVDVKTGDVAIYTYRQALEILHRPDTTAPFLLTPVSNTTARLREGRFVHLDQLSPEKKDDVSFRKALCLAVDALEATGVPIKIVALDQLENRKFIRDFARKIYNGAPIRTSDIRGGKLKKVAIIPRGRTLLKYVERYRETQLNDMALVDQDWCKGNRRRRMPLRTLELMSQATDEVFLDFRRPKISNVLRRLEVLIDQENQTRKTRGQIALKVISHKTMKLHIDEISSTARDIARRGERYVANNRSRGTTDTRALSIGELADVDECKISLMATVRKVGLWEALSKNDQSTLEEIDDIIHTRLWLIIVLDIATRMPLGWTLSDTTSADATTQALRMATRDKTREKIVYGCERDPMPAVGLGQIRSDNGSGVRNTDVKSAMLGLNTQTVDMRAYHGVEKPYVERMFGSIETILLQMIHGYTGRKAGALPGYDPIKNGVLNCDEIYGLITRYLVDEYPFQPHYGVGMMGQRPIKVAQRIGEIYGVIDVAPPLDRRVHLGWRTEAVVTDEGVKVFGLPYTSPDLQSLRDRIHEKVSVYSDPDLIDEVTILVKGHARPILARLSWTAMKGLTISEFLEFSASMRAETPDETIDFESQRIRSERKRFEQMRHVATKHNLLRSFTTREEAEAKARVVAAGLHAPTERTPNTAKPGSIGQPSLVDGVRKVGAGFLPPIENEDQETRQSDLRKLKRPDTEGKLS